MILNISIFINGFQNLFGYGAFLDIFRHIKDSPANQIDPREVKCIQK